MTIKLYTKKEQVINHKYFKKDFISTALSILQAYQNDIEYWATMSDKMDDFDNFIRDFVPIFETEIKEKQLYKKRCEDD